MISIRNLFSTLLLSVAVMTPITVQIAAAQDVVPEVGGTVQGIDRSVSADAAPVAGGPSQLNKGQVQPTPSASTWGPTRTSAASSQRHPDTPGAGSQRDVPEPASSPEVSTHTSHSATIFPGTGLKDAHKPTFQSAGLGSPSHSSSGKSGISMPEPPSTNKGSSTPFAHSKGPIGAGSTKPHKHTKTSLFNESKEKESKASKGKTGHSKPTAPKLGEN